LIRGSRAPDFSRPALSSERRACNLASGTPVAATSFQPSVGLGRWPPSLLESSISSKMGGGWRPGCLGATSTLSPGRGSNGVACAERLCCRTGSRRARHRATSFATVARLRTSLSRPDPIPQRGRGVGGRFGDEENDRNWSSTRFFLGPRIQEEGRTGRLSSRSAFQTAYEHNHERIQPLVDCGEWHR